MIVKVAKNNYTILIKKQDKELVSLLFELDCYVTNCNILAFSIKSRSASNSATPK